MKTESILVLLNLGVIVFSAAAAVAWLLSAAARVPAPNAKPGELMITAGDEPGENSFVLDGLDVIATAALQTKWNMRAAISACVAAVCQASAALPWVRILGETVHRS